MTISTFAAVATKTTTATNTPTLKITSPIKGQHVPEWLNLVVSGISSSKGHNGLCTVSVILNGLKPYQRVVAMGHNGTNDYSAWKYTMTPKYASIKQGQNKITAKISCLASPSNQTKFYSVNVTGIGIAHSANGQNGKNGANGSAINGNGSIAIGGNGGRGGNGGNGGSANGGNGGNGGNGSANGGNGGIAIGGNGGNGGNGGSANGGNEGS